MATCGGAATGAGDAVGPGITDDDAAGAGAGACREEEGCAAFVGDTGEVAAGVTDAGTPGERGGVAEPGRTVASDLGSGAAPGDLLGAVAVGTGGEGAFEFASVARDEGASCDGGAATGERSAVAVAAPGGVVAGTGAGIVPEGCVGVTDDGGGAVAGADSCGDAAGFTAPCADRSAGVGAETGRLDSGVDATVEVAGCDPVASAVVAFAAAAGETVAGFVGDALVPPGAGFPAGIFGASWIGRAESCAAGGGTKLGRGRVCVALPGVFDDVAGVAVAGAARRAGAGGGDGTGDAAVAPPGRPLAGAGGGAGAGAGAGFVAGTACAVSVAGADGIGGRVTVVLSAGLPELVDGEAFAIGEAGPDVVVAVDPVAVVAGERPVVGDGTETAGRDPGAPAPAQRERVLAGTSTVRGASLSARPPRKPRLKALSCSASVSSRRASSSSEPTSAGIVYGIQCVISTLGSKGMPWRCGWAIMQSSARILETYS